MPNERISMSKLKQLIGLQSSNLSVRAIGRALGLSVGAVSKYLRAVRACGIGAAEARRSRNSNSNGACSGRPWR
jgi:predicted transcriptional regulator